MYHNSPGEQLVDNVLQRKSDNNGIEWFGCTFQIYLDSWSVILDEDADRSQIPAPHPHTYTTLPVSFYILKHLYTLPPQSIGLKFLGNMPLDPMTVFGNKKFS